MYIYTHIHVIYKICANLENTNFLPTYQKTSMLVIWRIFLVQIFSPHRVVLTVYFVFSHLQGGRYDSGGGEWEVIVVQIK